MVLTRSSRQKSRECTCCYEPKKLDDFPSGPPTAACEHIAQTCLECLQHWWTACIQSHYWTVFVCPDCPENLLGGVEFRNSNMHDDDIDRCNYLHTRIRNGLNPDYRFCMQPGCDSGQVSHDYISFNCEKCNGIDCVPCDAPSHDDCASHEEYLLAVKDRRMESELNVAYIEGMKLSGKIVACPNCACLIEGHGSVKEAKCTRCMHCFLWDNHYTKKERQLGDMESDVEMENVGESNSATGRRHVMFTEDEASHRLIRPRSIELGPETPGKGH